MTNKVSTSFCVLLLIVKHLELDQTKMYLKHSNYYKPTCLEMALKKYGLFLYQSYAILCSILFVNKFNDFHFRLPVQN